MPDNWTSLTLGGAFPGASATIGNLKSQADGLFARYDALAAQMNARVSALQSMVNDSTSLANGLTEAGFYRVVLIPAAGGWADRATAAAGAPPNSGYSCGVLVVVQAPDLLSLGAKFDKLTAMLNTPINPG